MLRLTLTRGDGRQRLLNHMIVFLLLQAHGGELQVIGPAQPIAATVGDDIVLPCRLEPAVNASDLRLEWARPDLSPGFVYVWANSQEYVVDKQPSYRGRTSVSNDKLELGDVSLKLSKVKVSDEGTYRCLVPKLGLAAFIKLVVGAVSSPVISLMNRTSSGVVLQCESAGWYPEPEVLWLDAEGKLLSAGPPEAVRGPDGLYTVSSRVTVEERHGSSFTCRVQQKDINQTRETHVHVPAHGFVVQSSSDWIWIIGVPLCIAAFVFILCLFHLYCSIESSKRKLETLMQNLNICPGGEKKILMSDLELSRLSGEQKPENQKATGEGRESAAQQRKAEEETTDCTPE